MSEHREAVGDEPGNEQFRQIRNAVEKDHVPDSHAYFAILYEQVQKAFDNFSSRDVRNIQRAVDERILDFDFPQDWFDNPTLFYRKSYDEKKNMLIELMTSNMKGLSLSEIRRQEAIRYIDTMIQINQGGRERQISDMVERMALEREAAKRMVTADGDA